MYQIDKQAKGGLYDENITPSYVFDLDRLRERVEAVRAGIKRDGTKICFNVKANPFLVEVLKDQADYFEVCSPGEFHVCEKGEIPMEQVVVSGVYKAPLDIARFIGEHEGKSVFTAESFGQLQVLNLCAKMQGRQIRVLLRLTSGNQFGMESEEFKECISRQKEYENVKILGIQYYSGTQKKGLSKVEEELRMLDDFCEELKREYGFSTEVLEYGPGLSVPYFEKDEEEDLDRTLEDLNDLLDRLGFSGTVVLEMGRFLTAYCGSYYTYIVEIKRHGDQNYCIVDGGIHHLNYYGQAMGMRIPHYTHLPQEPDFEAPEQIWDVCGCLCTASDVLMRQIPMQNPRPGDLLIFERAGAYSVTEGISLFLSHDLPKVYFYSEEMGMELVREREGTCQWNMRTGEDETDGADD